MKPELLEIALKQIRAGVYSKNIQWMFGPNMNDMEEFAMVKALAGSPGMSSWLIQKVHHNFGVQYQVSKQVSDDLLATDFATASNIENVPWPAQTVELFFEDPALPTMMVMKYTPVDLYRMFPRIIVDLHEREYMLAAMQEGHGLKGTLLTLLLNQNMYEAFLDTAIVPEMTDGGPLSSTLSFPDNVSLCYMLHLCLKVFVFSSISSFAPVPILSRKQMNWGGKPDVNDRPRRPAFKVFYSPEMARSKPKAILKLASGRDFNGRRGHVRWFRSEKFVNVRGSWIFVRPVANPKTGKYPTP